MTNEHAEKRETAASFGAAADAYRDSDVHREGEDLDRLAEWCSDAEVGVDIATGAGHTAGALAAAGVDRVLATDASPAMVATAESAYPAVEGVVADAERLPLATDAADALACRIAAHHFPAPERFVDEVARVLRSGGTLAFEDNVAPPNEEVAAVLDRVERLRDPTHVESHPVERWTEWFRDAGFAVVETRRFTRTLEFDDWVAAQSLSADRRERVERTLLEAPPAAKEFLEIETDGNRVVSFANLKALIRARRE